MTKKYSNKQNISLPMAVWLARDTYDYKSDPSYVSATGLLKPIRAITLTRRNKPTDLTDLATLIASRVGTAIHDSFEAAWLGDYKNSLRALGYPEKFIEKTLVNPTPDEIKEDSICVYLEQRKTKEIGEYVIGGKFDMVADGVLSDLKTTKAYSIMLGSRDEDYKIQGSIYRWLNPELVTAPYINIQYVVTDWNKGAAASQKDKGYPQQQVFVKRIPLLSVAETEQWLLNQLGVMDKYKSLPQDQIPECTREELWQSDSVFKYYKKPGAARSTKNFDTLLAANERLFNDGSVGQVIEVKGTVNACKYCNAFEHCKQKDKLIQEGSLVLDT